MKASTILVILMLFLLVTGYENAESAGVIVIIIGGVALLVIIAAGWRMSRQRRAYENELVEWSAAQAVAAERMRIARELHDLASHGLGTVTVRAAAGRLTGAVEGYLSTLEDIEEVSRQATLELRRMLRLLRDSAGDPADFQPVEDLDSLPEILADAEARGQQVTADIAKIDNLSAGAQLAICAVVREGLMNVSQHAGNTKVHVSIARVRGEIRVEIVDAGSCGGWRPAPGAGYGLIGLRERIAVLGGSVETGVREVGFALTARIPGEENL